MPPNNSVTRVTKQSGHNKQKITKLENAGCNLHQAPTMPQQCSLHTCLPPASHWPDLKERSNKSTNKHDGPQYLPAEVIKNKNTDRETKMVCGWCVTHHGNSAWLQQLRHRQNREVRNVSKYVDDGYQRNWDPDCTRKIPDTSRQLKTSLGFSPTNEVYF